MKNGAFNSPLLVGFEHFERLLERSSKSAGDGYPPYNIERTGPERLRITVAVAGFAVGDLAVTLEDNQLIIRGSQPEAAARTFLHKGIASRQFQRTFVLAEGMEVTGADLRNGLLSIELERPKSDALARTIEIKSGRSEPCARRPERSS
jgi:HSP20 family molecular chaperone IbpA